ncbi:MAG: indole-3-glycerol phosphate synthase TrpC [Phycisphaerae bacterium]
MAKNILHTILETKRKEVSDLYDRSSLEEMKAAADGAERPRNFYSAVTARPKRLLNLIAEVKKASPSAGIIREDFDPVAIAQAYEKGGANALSVLTDEQYFRGSLQFLKDIRQAVDLPILRKDFIIDPIQVYQARAAGADAVLLIAAALKPGDLMDLAILATELRMTCLIEVHEADELLRLRSMVGFPHAGYSLLGINNRDLTTFNVDLNTTIRLKEFADSQVPVVSESGIRSRDDVRRLADAGVKAVLVGETLMRFEHVEEGIDAILGPIRKGNGEQ